MRRLNHFRGLAVVILAMASVVDFHSAAHADAVTD
jgi:hypothetical protein